LRMLCYYKSGGRSIPIPKLYKIMLLLSPEKIAFFRNNLENNLLELKCGKSGKPVVNPKFPLKLSKNLVRIIAHIIGDGGISNKPSNFTATYSNKSQVLLKEFKNDIENVFGKIKLSSFYDGKTKCMQLFYPSIVGLMLNRIIGVQSGKHKHIPDLILESNDNLKCIFLKSLFDDEGNVNMEAYKINFEIASYNIISGVKFMLNELLIKSSKIVRVDRLVNDVPRYKITVNGKPNLMRFSKLIGFNSKEKSERLRALINFYKIPHKDKTEVKEAIINLLRERRMSFYELATELQNQNIGAFRYSLRKLVQFGLVSFDLQHFGKGIRRVYKLTMRS